MKNSDQLGFFNDSIGGPHRVNNFLSILNIKPIDQKNLKYMERRAGQTSKFNIFYIRL